MLDLGLWVISKLIFQLWWVVNIQFFQLFCQFKGFLIKRWGKSHVLASLQKFLVGFEQGLGIFLSRKVSEGLLYVARVGDHQIQMIL